jgi:hypothetical protein
MAQRMGSLSSWLAALALLLSAAGARAEPPRIYVVAVPAAPEHELLAREVAALARAALVDAEGFRFREADVRVRGESASAREALAAGLEALGRGRQGYLAFELDGARAALEEALGHFSRAVAVLDSPEPVAQALMYLGACHVLAGDQAAARAAFTRHVAFAELTPDDRVFNPQVMQQWREARRQLEQKPRAKLVVEGASPLAEVSVDGRVRGLGPLTVEGLAPGEHWLRAGVPGVEPFAATLSVRPREAAKQSVAPAAEDAELAQLLGQAGDAAQAARLRELLEVDALAVLVVGASEAGAPAVRLTAVGKVQPVDERRPIPDDVGQRAQTARSLMAVFLERVAAHVHAGEGAPPAPVARAPLFPTEEAPPEPAARPWYKRGWVWGVIGGAVLAGAGAGLAVALTRGGGGGGGGPEPQEGATLTLEF